MFVEKLAPRLKASVAMRESPKQQRPVHRSKLDVLLAGSQSKAARNKAMVRLSEVRHTLAQIGSVAGLHYATVSCIIKAYERTS